MMGWYPVDAIVELNCGQDAVGEKIVMEGGFLDGHFPGRPLQPGVLTIEGMLEVARHLIIQTERAASDKEPVLPDLIRIEKARFLDIIVPGERLRLEVRITGWNGEEVRLKGRAVVDRTLKAEAIFVMIRGASHV